MTVMSLTSVLRISSSFQPGGSGRAGWNPLRAVTGWRRAPANAVPALPRGHDCGYLQNPQPDEHAMRVVGEKMLRAARRLGQPLSLLVMQLDDLPELELVFGRDAVDEVVDEAMTQLTQLAAREGFAVRTAPDTFTLLMPAVGADALLQAMQRRLGKPCCIEFELEGKEILLVPEVMARGIADDESVEQAYEEARRGIEKARRQEQRRQRHLRCERESHTTPAQLPAAAPQPSVRAVWEKTSPAFYPQLPATMPMPVLRR